MQLLSTVSYLASISHAVACSSGLVTFLLFHFDHVTVVVFSLICFVFCYCEYNTHDDKNCTNALHFVTYYFLTVKPFLEFITPIEFLCILIRLRYLFTLAVRIL